MRILITFLVALASFSILYLLDITSVLAYIGVGLLILILSIFPLLNVALWEKDVKKIEKFLLRNKKNPNFYIIYALGNKMDDEVKSMTEALLQKTSKKPQQALYKIQEALYFEDFDAAREVINDIEAPTYRYYYGSILLMEDGYVDKANRLIEQTPIKWMHHALIAEREKRKNSMDKAKKNALIAIESSKGLQKYVLQKTYEREFGI